MSDDLDGLSPAVLKGLIRFHQAGERILREQNAALRKVLEAAERIVSECGLTEEVTKNYPTTLREFWDAVREAKKVMT